MIELENRVIALSGPSGVGKGHLKSRILEASPCGLAEPVVATTRMRRGGDGPDRMAGLSVAKFRDMVSSGDVVLPHQPFGTEESPYYGFLTESFDTGSPLLTEFHPSVLSEAKNVMPMSYVIGLLASRQQLIANMTARDSVTDRGEGLEARIAAFDSEYVQLLGAISTGEVDLVFNMSPEFRDVHSSAAVMLVSSLLQEGVTDVRV